MHDKSQFVPWRTAVGAAVVSVLALSLAAIAHADYTNDTIKATVSVVSLAGDALGLATVSVAAVTGEMR